MRPQYHRYTLAIPADHLSMHLHGAPLRCREDTFDVISKDLARRGLFNDWPHLSGGHKFLRLAK